MTLSPRALSPEAQALFDEAREASEQPDAGVPDDARGRMRANVLAAAAAGGVTAAATAAKAAGAAGTTKAAATATGASGAGKAMMWLGSLSTGKMVIGFVAAAGLTLGGLTVLDPQPPREAIAPTPSATAVAAPADEPETNVDAAPAAEPSRIDEAEQTARAEPTTARPTPGAPAPSASTETLEEQAALLMRARDAIRQGRHGQAQRRACTPTQLPRTP